MKFALKGLYLTAVFLVAFAVSGKSALALTLTPVRLEISGNPGETIHQEITLINEGVNAETFYSSFANFSAEGESGNPTFTNGLEGLSTWITAPGSVFLPAGLSKPVQVSITIPRTAEPGGYFGAVFWGSLPDNVAPGEVAIGAKTGVLVLLSVKGDVEEKAGLSDFNTKDGRRMYSSLPVAFTYRFRNEGGDRVKPEGDIVIKNIFGLTSALVPANKVEGNVLPTQVRRFETTWVGSRNNSSAEPKEIKGFFQKAKYEWQNFALGHYSAKVKLAYGAEGMTAEEKIGLWIVPWHFLSLFIIFLWIALFVLRRGLRAYNRRIIRQAHLHGTARQDNSDNQRRF